jgi:hypothetical protein
MFDVLLALDRLIRRFIYFEINQAIDFVVLRVTGKHPISVLVDTADKIVRDANIKSAARTTCENIYVELTHPPSFTNRDGRDKPGHDGSGVH